MIQGMHVFQRTVSEDTRKRFQDVMSRLSGPLAAYLRKSRHEHRPTAIRLMFLGQDEDSARPWIVVLCPEPVKKRAEKFFKQDMAQRLCQLDEPGRESFHVVVVGHAPRPKTGGSARRVTMSSGLPTGDGSILRTFSSSSQADTKYHGKTSSAAIGGYILVSNFDGTEVVYGLTAGHVFPQTGIDSPSSDGPWGGSIPSPDSSDLEDNITGIPEHSAEDRGQSLLESFIGPRSEPAWTGMVLAEVSFSREARDRDWALIERIRTTQIESLYTKAPEREVVLGTMKDLQPAQLYFGAEVALNCTISRDISMILTPSGHNFVQAHILTLDASKSIPGGASGTWITSPLTRSRGRRMDVSPWRISVYGQVVADDIFEDGYMVPLTDIMEDIKKLTKAAAVRLPLSLSEVGQLLSKQRDREEPDQLDREKAISSFPTNTRVPEDMERVEKRPTTTGMKDHSTKVDSYMPALYQTTEEASNRSSADIRRGRAAEEDERTWGSVESSHGRPASTPESKRRVTRSSTRTNTGQAKELPDLLNDSPEAEPKAPKGQRAAKPKRQSQKGAKSEADAQPVEDSDPIPQSYTTLTIIHDLVKKPIQCHQYTPITSLSTPLPTLFFTHGAGGTLSADAVVNFCSGFSSSCPVLAFQGSMNLKARTKGFHACIDELNSSQETALEGAKEERAGEKTLLLGGRSMGARAAVIAASEHLASLDDSQRERLSIQLILVSYPLLGPKDELRDQVLLDLPKRVRILFISGDEDGMCPIDLLNETREKLKAKSQLVVVTNANHGMHVVPASRTRGVGEETGRVAARWVEGGIAEDEVYIDELEGEEER
ncbi:hypothetical protein BKA58DRAFT_318314 [Alternaria rosae]|uniref:uncharacterized protein n=1 Tax=Alternaria rosae TaxID=1187941 RepID=UPI001E8CFFC8|nr:uncharacterized protein BKA58DRAFT_318314 [Alternaria rosae]KAH6866339.1 hypothetical protein BKA58DRAFT_318314 [Alternaria rosae]